MKYWGILLVLVAIIATSSFMVFRSERKEGGGGTPSGLSPDYFSIDRVYFDDWVDFMGNVSPYDFAIVVEITSGGRGVTSWSVGIDRGLGKGLEDNIIWTDFGGFPSPENHKFVLREDMPKWFVPSATNPLLTENHPQRGKQYYVKVHLTLSDNSYMVWEGNTGYL